LGKSREEVGAEIVHKMGKTLSFDIEDSEAMSEVWGGMKTVYGLQVDQHKLLESGSIPAHLSR
jgi:hypothetical protein